MTWRERIVAARERGAFTDHDVDDARGSWLTCAIGEQHAAHPDVVVYSDETPYGGPVDGVLRTLGGPPWAPLPAPPPPCGFNEAVVLNAVDLAEDLLDQIEDRVLQLKREQVAL